MTEVDQLNRATVGLHVQDAVRMLTVGAVLQARGPQKHIIRIESSRAHLYVWRVSNIE